MIKRLRCVVYLDDRIPEEADILDFFNLGGARRLRSEAFRRLLLSGWIAANQTQTHAMSRQASTRPVGADKDKTRLHENGTGSSGDGISAVPTFNGNSDGLLYDNETMSKIPSQAKAHADQAKNEHEDFFGKLF